jgi:RNA polymerase sigma-70 factor (ECF subfamily)
MADSDAGRSRSSPLSDRTGTPADLDAWVRAGLPYAVAYAESMLRDRSAAEDVVHDCYCNLLRKADVYDLLRDGTKILMRSITNASINHNKRTKRFLSLSPDDEAGTPQVADPRSDDPADNAVGHDLQSAVAEGLDRLPPQQRAALELRSLGHSLQEISDALGVSLANAGVLVHRARQALGRMLTPYLKDQVG